MVSFRFLQPLLQTLRDLDIDPKPILRRAGMQPALTTKSSLRLPEPVISQLCNLAIDTSGDSALMLKAGNSATPASLGVLGYVLQNARDMREAWAYLQRYWRLLHDEPILSIDIQADMASVSLRAQANSDPSSRQALIEYFFAFLLRLTGTLVGGLGRGHEYLQAIEFRHPRPSQPHLQACQQWLKTPRLYFDRPRNTVRFRTALLDQPVSCADRQMLALMTRQAQTEMQQLRNRTPISARVIDLLRQRLPGRAPTLPEIADACQMSRATLQRRLAGEGHNYRKLLDQLRRELAEQMLTQETTSIGEIAFALDYADTAAFHHAYKRWTGRSPGQSGLDAC